MKKSLLILVAIPFLLSGCFFGGGSDKPIEYNYQQIHSGSQGVLMSFLPEKPQGTYNLPKDTNHEIYVSVLLENGGASDVNNGVVALNYDSIYYSFSQYQQPFSLQGKSFASSKGQKQTYFFSGNIKPILEGSKDTTISAVACYDYTTEYSFDVCIDTDPGNTKPMKKACDVQKAKDGYVSAGGQGGPVVISKIDQTVNEVPGGLDIEFIIRIRNSGRGRVFDVNSGPAQLCGLGGSKSPQGLVNVQVELAGSPINCGGSTTQIPLNDDGIIICKVSSSISSNTPSYLSSLKVHLAYDYVDSLGKNIILKKIGAKT